MFRTKVLNIAVLLGIAGSVNAQQKFWVYHGDTTRSYLSSIGLQSEYCSSWLNACSYYLSKNEQLKLKNSGIAIYPILAFSTKTNTVPDHALKNGFAIEQIEGELLVQQGLTGKGTKIGIIDGGFFKANTDPSLIHFFENDQVMGVKDFLYPDQFPFEGEGLRDSHGSQVWKLIGGKNQEKRIRYGLANDATCFLARTEHEAYEKRIEEDYLIAAMEWMAGEGVRIINISLGYNLGYTSTEENYRPEQMDGKTTAIAKAVEMASTEKGILVVVAAGNEGEIDWQIVSTPADAQHALTVGASRLNTMDKMEYSSIGPSFVPYLKPDIMVFSSAGTSFAAPVITGLAACIMQYAPRLSNLEVIDIIHKSGSCYPYGNNYIGYGVPTCSNVLKILEGLESEIIRPQKIETTKNQWKIRRTFAENYVVAYHKKDEKNVIKRVVYRSPGRKIKIKRIDNAVSTTVLDGKSVIEICWQ